MVTYLRGLVRLTGAIALLVSGNPPLAAESTQWLFDIRYTVTGISQILSAQQQNQCLSTATPMPDISRPGYECKSSRHIWFGKTLIWQVDCSNEWESIQGTGRVSFDKEGAAGDIYLQIINPTNPPEYMVLDIQGKPLGACKKDLREVVEKPLTRLTGRGLTTAANKSSP